MWLSTSPRAAGKWPLQPDATTACAKLPPVPPRGNIIWEQIDVTAPDCVDRFALLIERLGGVDTVLLCAGVGYQDPDATDSILVIIILL